MRIQDEVSSDKIGFVMMNGITFIIEAIVLLVTSSLGWIIVAEVTIPFYPATLIIAGMVLIKKGKKRFGVSLQVCAIVAIGLLLLLTLLRNPTATIARLASLLVGVLLFVFPGIPAKIMPRVE